MRTLSRISRILRSNVRSEFRRKFFATCWVMVEAPWTWREPCRNTMPARAMPFGIEPAVRVEVLVLGGDEGFLDQIGNRGGGEIKPALARIFRQQAAVGGMDAGHHRRLVILELAVVGKILLVLPDDGAEHRRRDDENDRAGREYEAEEPNYPAHRANNTLSCARGGARLPETERTSVAIPVRVSGAERERLHAPRPRPDASSPRIRAGPQSFASAANL